MSVMSVFLKLTIIFSVFLGIFLAPGINDQAWGADQFTCCQSPAWKVEGQLGKCWVDQSGAPILGEGNICTTGQSCNFATGRCEGSKRVEDVIGKIEPPEAISNIGPGAIGLNNFLNKIVELIYLAATIIFVFMVLISGLQWLLSGGEKEGVAGAQKRLTWAIIGIAFLALAFVIIKILGNILGFEFFAGQNP